MLEIVIVLAIIVLIAGASMPFVGSMVRGEQLKNPARVLEAMAVTARTRAMSEQQLYHIVLNPTGFRLETTDPGGGLRQITSFELPAGVEFQIASWPDQKWGVPRNRLWYFPPVGLCEPIQILFRKGDSYFSQTFGAVTGWEREATSRIQ